MADVLNIDFQKAGLTPEQYTGLRPEIQGLFQKQYPAAPNNTPAPNTGLSGQIAALLGPSSTGDAAGTPAQAGPSGGYSPVNPDGSFAIGQPGSGMRSYLVGTETSTSGMDPKQLQTMLDYINNTGAYSQNVINQGFDQATSSLERSGAPDINAAALQRMGLLQGLNVGGQTMSPQERDALLMSMPGYQFQFEQGKRAVESSGASRGLLGSGALLRSLTEFGQGLASTNFANTFGQLATLAGVSGGQAGQLASLQATRGSELSSAAANTANQYSSALSQGGNRATVTNKYDTAMKGMEFLQSLGAHGVSV